MDMPQDHCVQYLNDRPITSYDFGRIIDGKHQTYIPGMPLKSLGSAGIRATIKRPGSTWWLYTGTGHKPPPARKWEGSTSGGYGESPRAPQFGGTAEITIANAAACKLPKGRLPGLEFWRQTRQDQLIQDHPQPFRARGPRLQPRHQAHSGKAKHTGE